MILCKCRRCCLEFPNQVTCPLESFLKFSSLTTSSPLAITPIMFPRSLAFWATSKVSLQSRGSIAADRPMTFNTFGSLRPLLYKTNDQPEFEFRLKHSSTQSNSTCGNTLSIHVSGDNTSGKNTFWG